MSKNKNSEIQTDQKAKAGESFGSFIGAVILILSIRWLLFEPYVIPSGSMIPTLLIHDHILVNKMAYGVRVPFTKKWIWTREAPKRGEIIVFRSTGPEEEYFMIKRIVGIAGDNIEIQEGGQLVVNGTPVARTPLTVSAADSQAPYYKVSEKDLGGAFDFFNFYEEQTDDIKHRVIQMKEAFRYGQDRFTVPADHVFMMGDNRDNSKDSRFWGPLPVENILGRATYVWLSCEETLSIAPFLCNPLELRWSRFFHEIK